MALAGMPRIMIGCGLPTCIACNQVGMCVVIFGGSSVSWDLGGGLLSGDLGRGVNKHRALLGRGRRAGGR